MKIKIKLPKTRQKGFTLMELLVYISLLVAVLTGISAFFTTVISARAKNQSINEVNQQGAAMMDYMTQTVRNADSINGSTASSVVMGYNVDGGSTDSGDSGAMNGTSMIAPYSGTISTLFARIGPTVSASPNNKGQMAIYKDIGDNLPYGKPGQLLANSADVVLTASSWVAFPITPINVVAGQEYWIVYNTNGSSSAANNLRFHTITTGENTYSQSAFLTPQTYGTWPSAWPSLGTGTNNLEFSVYAQYTSVVSTSASSQLSLNVPTGSLSPTIFTLNNGGGGGGATSVMGNNTDGTTDDVRILDHIESMNMVAPATGPITTLYAKLGDVDFAPNNHGQMAIYSAGANGLPAAKLASSSTVTLTPFAWNSFTIPSVSVTEGQLYWLAFETDSQSNNRGVLRVKPSSTSGKTRSLDNKVFVSWPTTPWGGFLDNGEYSMYAVVNGTPGGGPTTGTLYVKEGAGGYVALNDSKVIVSNLSFNILSSPGTPGVVRISFTLSRINANNRYEFDYQKTFTSTASVRP